MDIRFTDSFTKSLKKLIIRESWWYKTYEIVRYKIPKFLKNIWYFKNELWEHRDWDYSFSLMMFKRSLESLSFYLENYGYEVDKSRLKKIKKIKRVISLLDNIRTDNYIIMAEENLGSLYSSSFEFEETENDYLKLKNNLTEFQRTHNQKVYNLASEIEEKEWKEIWKILEGQDIEEYRKLYNSQTEEQKRERELWDEWYDGSGMKHWWD